MSSSTAALGRLMTVELREAWQSESGNFTPWLAQPANIALLGDAIGLDLEVEAQEKAVGLFRADILCKDTANQTWVLIENQLEKTDHGHLGQLITYAAGLEAATIIWVAAKVRDEHRAAIDWLNEITSEEFSFFALEVELWRIENSPPAPKFNIACKPNDWSRTITKAAKRVADGTLSETAELQLEYWDKLRELMETRGGLVNPKKPYPQNFMEFSLGKAGIWMCTTMSVQKKVLSVQLVVGTNHSEAYFKLLEQDRVLHESNYGCELLWWELPGQKLKQVRIELSDVDPADRQQWPIQHDWIYENLQKMHATFADAAKTLDPDDYV